METRSACCDAWCCRSAQCPFSDCTVCVGFTRCGSIGTQQMATNEPKTSLMADAEEGYPGRLITSNIIYFRSYIHADASRTSSFGLQRLVNDRNPTVFKSRDCGVINHHLHRMCARLGRGEQSNSTERIRAACVYQFSVPLQLRAVCTNPVGNGLLLFMG